MFFLAVISIIALVGIDQIAKMMTLNMLKPIGSVEIIRNFFYLTYVENTGAAFGFMSGARWIFVVVTLGILIAGGIYYYRMPEKNQTVLTRLSFVLIFAGAMGNFLDRLFRGYVVDMIHFVFWGYDFAVFNFADIFVVCGTMILAVSIIFFSVKEDKKEV